MYIHKIIYVFERIKLDFFSYFKINYQYKYKINLNNNNNKCT